MNIFYKYQKTINHVHHTLPQERPIYSPEWINVQLLERRDQSTLSQSLVPIFHDRINVYPDRRQRKGQVDNWSRYRINLSRIMARGGTKAFSRLPVTWSDAWNSREETCFHPVVLRSFQEQWPRSVGETFTSERFQREKERERERELRVTSNEQPPFSLLLPRSRRGKRLPVSCQRLYSWKNREACDVEYFFPPLYPVTY